MKLYTKTIYTITALAAAATLWSCDNIDTDDRFIEIPAVEAARTVLLEEYTGQKCVNCPTAHSVITDLLSLYNDNLVAVSIHGGGDAFSYNVSKYPYGLANDDSQRYCDEAGAASLPAGVVNRTSGVTNYDQWGGLIRSEMSRPANLDMSCTAVLTGNTIDIKTELAPYDNIDAHLQLWIVESGIVSIQLTPNGRVTDYVHNHVFRSAVNGHDGETLHMQPRQSVAKTHTIECDSRWKPENISVVAFVYNDKGVLQAAKTHLTVNQ